MICVVTGVTGLVGSHVAIALVEAEHRVIALGRASRERNADQRVRHVLGAYPGWGDCQALTAVQTVDADLDVPLCGVDTRVCDTLAGAVDVAVHCAGNVAFADEDAAALERTNIEGVRHVIELTARLKCRRLVHVSTAYVDRGVRGETCRTAYERSKLEGEKLMLAAAAEHGTALTLVRPSIVTGDRQHGFTPTYHGIYPFLRYGATYWQQLITAAPSKWMPWHLMAKGRVNLVPADYLAGVIRSIIERPIEASTMNVTNPDPWHTLGLVKAVARYFGIHKFPVRSSGEDGADIPPEATKAITALEEAYRPYTMAELSWDPRAAADLAAQVGSPPLQNNDAWIHALLKWAIARNWQVLS